MTSRTTALKPTPGTRWSAPAPPPRWARIAAHAAALTPLPTALWRLLLLVGFSAGFTEQGLVVLDVAGWGGRFSLVALSVLTELAALLTLGLVQPWGEVVPRWVPHLGGRCIPPRPVVLIAFVGAAILLVLWTPFLFWWNYDRDMTPAGKNMVGLLYLPLVAWAPLLAAVTVSYAKRHRAFELGSR